MHSGLHGGRSLIKISKLRLQSWERREGDSNPHRPFDPPRFQRGAIPLGDLSKLKSQILNLRFKNNWRRGWDSNPRYPLEYNGFRDRPIQPLSHLSAETCLFGYSGKNSIELSTLFFRRCLKNACINLRHSSARTPEVTST